MRRIGVRHGHGDLAKSRQAATYLSKHVAETFTATRPHGSHRYQVAPGFAPGGRVLPELDWDVIWDAATEIAGVGGPMRTTKT